MLITIIIFHALTMTLMLKEKLPNNICITIKLNCPVTFFLRILWTDFDGVFARG